MIKSKRIAHRIYEAWHNGVRFEIDGQNHEFDSKEWELFVYDGDSALWVETYPTKREALADIERIEIN